MKIFRKDRLSGVMLIVFLLIVIFPSNSNVCQTVQLKQSDSTESAEHSLGIKLGVNDFHMKDKYLSPLPFRGAIFSTELSFLINTPTIRHRIEIYFSHGSPSPHNEVFNITQNIGLLSYSFLHRINKWNIADIPLVLSLGAGLSSFVMNSDLITNSKLGEGYYIDQSWYWSHSLNVCSRFDYLLSENKILSVQLAVPFFKVVSRPANGHWSDAKNLKVIQDSFFNAAKGGRGEFFWNKFAIICDLEYQQKLNNHFAIHGMYRFDYTSSKVSLSMGMYMNNFLFGIDWIL